MARLPSAQGGTEQAGQFAYPPRPGRRPRLRAAGGSGGERAAKGSAGRRGKRFARLGSVFLLTEAAGDGGETEFQAGCLRPIAQPIRQYQRDHSGVAGHQQLAARIHLCARVLQRAMACFGRYLDILDSWLGSFLHPFIYQYRPAAAPV